MRTVTIGPLTYRIPATGRDGQWVARGERVDTGDRFGIECTGASPEEAADRVVRWLEWQHDHAAALEDLQLAERAYHRTIAGSAFAGSAEGPAAIDMRRESLDAVEAARVRLDAVRARNPIP